MQLVQKHIINRNHSYFNECDNICFLSKNLYNSTLYNVRQHYFSTKEYLNYNKINKIFTDSSQKDYIALPRKVSKQTQMLLDKNFKSFFKLLNKKQTSDFNKKIKTPNYLNPIKGRFITTYEKGAISLKELDGLGYIKLSGTEIKIYTDKTNIKQVRIVPKCGYYVIEVIYEIADKEIKKNNNRYCGIDLGVNNLATLTSNVIKPLIINGKPLKSINQYYNKKKGELQSKLKEKFSSEKIKRLGLKRNNKIEDYLHKSSNYIVNHLVSNNINTLIIGHNNEWKQDANMSKRNNQNFIGIPFNKLILMLQYKSAKKGISVIITEESYTSKASFINNDKLPVYKKGDDSDYKFSGYRESRGIYKIKNCNIRINADINGSYNIIRKVVPELQYGIEDLSVNPVSFTIPIN